MVIKLRCVAVHEQLGAGAARVKLDQSTFVSGVVSGDLIRGYNIRPGTKDAALLAISQDLAKLARQVDMLTAAPSDTARSDISSPQVSVNALVRHVIRLRRLREQVIGQNLFADPGWDILLDLTLARLEGRQTSVSSLCIAASVPTSTALRWIRSLQKAGVVACNADPGDGRRSHVEISDNAFEKMIALMSKPR